jgi:hypothetical protein
MGEIVFVVAFIAAFAVFGAKLHRRHMVAC